MRAKVIGHLVYFDEPQLVLLSAGKSKIMAVAVEKSGVGYAFFCCMARKYHLNRYMNGKMDLLALFELSSMGRYYFFDWNNLDENQVVALIPATPEEILNEDYWPQRGFFSTAHTEGAHLSYQSSSEGVVSQMFNIDGVWDASEFSLFYGKLSDIYAIFHARNKLEISAPGDSTLRKLKEDIIARLWRGGGSYSGFYSAMEKFLPDMNPLTVSRIQWASPGNIVFKGQEDIFTNILNSLSRFEPLLRDSDDNYKSVDRILSKRHLKTATPDTVISDATLSNDLKVRSFSIMRSIGFDRNDELLGACDGNILVYAKVSLSIYRRFRGIYSFISEGRVDPFGSEQN